jgi:mannose/fructose/N-acetylgalactosamine-specific phosphotransferase system component IIC
LPALASTCLISAALAIGMLPVLGAMLLVVLWLARLPWPLWLLGFVYQRLGIGY